MFKLKLLIVMTALIGAFVLSGCTSQTVSQEEYNLLIEENKSLVSELDSLAETSIEETVETTVTGGFVAKVRGFTPNYTLDDFTPLVAILTPFQGGPFMVHIGEDMATQLQVDERYYFEVEDKMVGEISKREFDMGGPQLELAFPLYNLRISSFRMATDDEFGLNSPYITYVSNDG